ncbi:MAG: hypothetical protein MHMPM18_002163 [Marteilia pararefringens]
MKVTLRNVIAIILLFYPKLKIITSKFFPIKKQVPIFLLRLILSRGATSPDSSSQNSEIDNYGHHHDLESEDELEETSLFPAIQQQFRHEATLTDIIDTPPTYNEAMNQIRDFMNTDSQRRPLRTDPTPVIEVELPPPGYEEAMNLIRYSVDTDSPTLPSRTDTTPSIIGLSPPENEETLNQMRYSEGINSRTQPIYFSTVLMRNVAHRDSRDNSGRGNENAGSGKENGPSCKDLKSGSD